MKKMVVLLLSLSPFLFHEVIATHIKAGSITYKRISDQSLEYEFTLTGLADIQSPVRFADGIFEFGDGSSINVAEASVTLEADVFVGPRQDIELYVVTIRHTYSAPGVYTVRYREPNRNDEIVNINFGNSVQTPFSLQALLVLDPRVGTNSSPVFNNLPYDQAAVGKMFSHNGWATDIDGDSLSYRLVYPLQDEDQVVPNYTLPSDAAFYSNHQRGNETADNPPSFFIDPITGNLLWDAPGDLLQNSQGDYSEYNVAYIVEEWRQVDGNWVNIGYITRDMQIEVSQQITGRPDFSVPEVTEYTAGTTISEIITFTDPLDYQIKVETFGALFEDGTNPVQLSAVPEDYVNGPLEVSVTWTPQPDQIRNRPYLLHFKVTNQPPTDQEPLVTYKTWVISNTPLTQIKPPGISTPPSTSNLVTGLFEPSAVRKAKLFPNPVDDQLQIELDTELHRIQELSIFNGLGQRTKWVLNPSYLVTSISVGDLSPGFYVVELRTKQAVYSGKFLKN